MIASRFVAREWVALAVGASSIFLMVLDVGLLSLALPAIEEEFAGSSRAVLGFAATAYLVVLASLLVLGGRLADRRGRRRAFHLGLAVTAVAAVLTGLAPTAEALVGARALQGAGAALITPTALAMVLPDIPIGRRALAVGLWGVVGAAAALLGPVLGGFFVDLVGWRYVFGGIAPLALLAYLAGRGVLRESVDPTAPKRLDLFGVVLGVVAVGALTLAILQGNDWGWGSAPILGAAVASLVAGWLFWRNLGRSDAPILDRDLLAHPGFWAPTLSAVFSQLAFFAFFFSGPVLLTKVWGFSATRTGLALAPAMLLSIITQGPFGAWCDRHGYRAMLVIGGLVPAAGIAWWVGQLTTRPDYWTDYLPGLLAIALGGSMVGITSTSASLAVIADDRLGVANAVHQTARRVGSALGVAIAIGLTGGRGAEEILDGLVTVWLVVAAAYAAGSAVVAAWYAPRPAGARPG